MYRSRLQRVEEKRNVKKAMWLVILTLAVIGSAIIWGIPLLVKLAIFIGDLNASKTPIDRTDIIPPAPPQFNSMYEATNSATQVVSGWTEPGARVYLTQNENSVSNVLAKDDGSFQFNDINLDTGKNDFVAIAMDVGGNKSLPSSIMSIKFANQTPKLEISSPADQQVVYGSEAKVDVKGKTDPGNRVTINGRIMIVMADGGFFSRLGLVAGNNLIKIVSTDRMGNKAETELNVVYTP